jgi:hypothetical protein
MSSGHECHFYEIERGRWIYVLEDGWAPKNVWDWREHATPYGPFDSLDLAEDHLRENHANPGGHATIHLPEGQEKIDVAHDEVLKGLVERVLSPSKHEVAVLRPVCYYRG